MKALLLIEFLSLMTLWRVGPLLDTSNPLDLLMAAMRIVALAWLVWMVYSTIAELTSTRPALTNPLARRLVHRAIAAAIVTGAVTTPVQALAATPTADSSGILIPLGAFVPSTPDEVPAKYTAAQSSATVVVQPGDNLWKLSERHLRSIETDPSPRRIAGYWATVVAANEHHLRSGDPDLVYPGETITLP
jgi:nucleoid-associated protein YgaU